MFEIIKNYLPLFLRKSHHFLSLPVTLHMQMLGCLHSLQTGPVLCYSKCLDKKREEIIIMNQLLTKISKCTGGNHNSSPSSEGNVWCRQGCKIVGINTRNKKNAADFKAVHLYCQVVKYGGMFDASWQNK